MCVCTGQPALTRMTKVAKFYCVHALADAEHVAGFKLLGVLITSDLKWNTHTLIKFVQNPPHVCIS